MEYDAVSRLIADNMKSILGFSVSRLSDRHDAEDLAGDIIYEVLRSAPRLNDDDKFYAFMWRIAENTYSNFLRKRKSRLTAASEPLDDAIENGGVSVQDELILREDTLLLRRELSLLSEQYRASTVLYYIDGMSCASISRLLNISVDMVKYYLFRARKILKEGMSMERNLGEKSYNPENFEIDFWGSKGGDDDEYRAFRKRRIRGNILLAAYYTPVTLSEMSLELGVAAPYLEDELRLLMKRLYIIERGGKYQTNIPIFTVECNEEIKKRLTQSSHDALGSLIPALDEACAAFKAAYGGKFPDDAGENLLRWQVVTLCGYFGAVNNSFDDNMPSDGPYSLINGGGGRGYVWGRSIPAGNEPQIKMNGVYQNNTACDGRSSITAYNFVQLENTQNYCGNLVDMVSCVAVNCYAYLPDECRKLMDDLGYAVDGKPNFPVYTEAQFDGMYKLLKVGIDEFAVRSRTVYELSGRVTADHAPQHIRDEAMQVASVVRQLDSLAYIADALMNEGWLKPVGSSFKPAMYAVFHHR